MSKNIKKWFICCLVLSLLFTSFPQMSVWAENTEQPAQSEVSEGEECVVSAEADTEETGVSEEPVVSVEEVAPYVILADGETLPQTKADEVSVLSDDVVQLETEDALYQYLKEQIVVRNSQITVSVPVEINNKVGPINAMTSAQKYTEACTGQEGDALKYGGVGYSVSTTSYSGAARVTYTYYMNYYTTAEQEKQLTSAVTSALASLNLDGKTEAEKVVAIHNYICDHVDYDYDGLSDSSNTVKYTAYGALCNGKAVCNGYAVLFYRMCKEAGLSVRIISGTANGGSHAWNIVKVGDVYYAVDSTWDGQDAQTLDQYLLKSEKDFSADHTRSAEYTTEEFNDAYPMALNSYYEKTFNDSLNRDNPQYDNVALDGTTVATVSFSKPKILIYFSTQCGYSQATIGEISKNTYTGADIVAVAVNTTSVDDVTAFKNTYGNDDICFAYKNVEDSPIAQNQMWSYVHMNTSATHISFPVIVYIDSNNKVQNVTTGYQTLSDIEENMQHYCGVISDGNVYTIKYNPNGGTGDSIRKTYPVNTTAVVEECTYAKDGYSFSGWNTKADGSGTGYKPGDAISSPKSNIVLYAQWNANVTLDNVVLGKFVNIGNGVQINWKEVANAESYRIGRRAENGKWKVLTNSATGSSYTDTTAEDGVTYYYTVRAINGSVVSASYDTKKSITCVRSLGKAELQEFKNTSSGVEVNWKEVANAENYRVGRRAENGKWKVLTNSATGSSYTDTTAEDGVTYYYTVRAINGSVVSASYDTNKSITYKKLSVEIPQTTFSKTSGNVTFKVQYPENITCGVPTTFKLSSEGTTDKVQYALYSLTTEDGTIVYDTSYGSNGKFFSKDSFDFTFYASGTYYIRFAIMDTGVSPYVWFNTGLYGIKLVIDDKGYPTVENVVADLKAQCEKTCTTDYEKAVWFNDWLVENCRYDFSYSYCAPEGALARGLGTCEAYHRAYVMLLNSVGIATDRISGDGHVWTGVQLDGNWYHIDTTWDDAGYEDNSVDLQHLYFGLNDELMNQIHSSVTSSNGISAHSLEDNYFIKTGKIKKWSDQYVSTIREHLNNGENTFDITINDSMIDSYKQIIYYLVAYQLSNTDWSGDRLVVTYSENILHCVVE